MTFESRRICDKCKHSTIVTNGSHGFFHVSKDVGEGKDFCSLQCLYLYYSDLLDKMKQKHREGHYQ